MPTIAVEIFSLFRAAPETIQPYLTISVVRALRAASYFSLPHAVYNVCAAFETRMIIAEPAFGPALSHLSIYDLYRVFLRDRVVGRLA